MVYYATPVYQLYNKEGVKSRKIPPVNEPIQNRVAYHIREGKHDITDYDLGNTLNGQRSNSLVNYRINHLVRKEESLF